MNININDFLKIEIRVGKILRAEPFTEAIKPAIKLWIDFGPEIGERKSSAQITYNYDYNNVVGRQILAVTNLPPRQIGKFLSEVLVLGVPDKNGEVILVSPDKPVPLSVRMY
tara:strand:- start:230 stop:565 length:336 start_codon:yes stop_codon:yes gene_type:complete